MTIYDIYGKIKDLGISTVYDHFEKATKPPFLVYNLSSRNDKKADNRSYTQIWEGVIELYTSKRDFQLEEKVESLFFVNELPFELVNHTFIEATNMYLSRWEFEIILEEVE